MLANAIRSLRVPSNYPLLLRFSSATNGDRIQPKKFERTPVGRLEDEQSLKAKKQPDQDEDKVPRRRIINPETGEIGGPRVSFSKRFNINFT